jgi:hypothetical protein
VEIEEKLEDTKLEQVKPKKKLSDAEIKELRRKQQERALRTQAAINEELKKSREGLYSKEEADALLDQENEIEEAVRAVKVTDLNFMDQLKEQIVELDEGAKFDQEAELLEAEKSLTNLIKDYDKNIDRVNNSAVQKLLREKSKKQVKWSDSNEHLEKVVEEGEDEEDYDYADDRDDDDEVDYTDSDDDYEDEEDDSSVKVSTDAKTTKAPAVIKIKHTKSEMLDELERRHRLSRERPALDNPGDIYNMFYKPKSILKNTDETGITNKSADVTKSVETVGEKTVREAKNVLNEKFEPEKVFFA